jgi:hypothetical protein
VFIMQPALPKYRVPVFRELAQRPGLSVTVSRGDEPHVPSVAPDGFAAFESKHHRIRLAGVMGIEWHAPSASDLKGADVLVLPWNLRDEIVTQLAFVRDWGGRFAVAVPALQEF